MYWQKITTLDKLIALLPELTNLFNNSSHESFFNSGEWLQCWLQNFWQSHWQLHCFIAYNNETPIAFLPFYTQSAKYWPLTNTLHLLGQGEPELSGVASEYLDFTIHPDHVDSVIAEINTLLSGLPIDQFFCRALLANSHVSAWLEQANFKRCYRQQATRYLVDKNHWQLGHVSKNTHSRYKRALNQLNKINANFVWVKPENYHEYFNQLIKFHQTRWQKKGKSGAFAHQDFVNFHQQLLNKHVKMSAILVDNKPISINYYLIDKDTPLYFYQSGWDELNYAKYSPGLALHIWSINNSEQRYYDFMMGGNNNSYKAKFSGDKEVMISYQVNINPIKILITKVINKMTRFCKSMIYLNTFHKR